MSDSADDARSSLADDLARGWSLTPGPSHARPEDGSSPPVAVGEVGCPASGASSSSGERRPAIGRVAQAGGRVPPGPPAYPRSGEQLAGFRIVSELGRGAFARVYLAEQVDLAHRQVALKVSRALGDEPQILARFQHTHIVPIHSVHDDPATGLRLLCMPYLGGANLAQVLETAGAHLPTQVSGMSLVEALDRVGNKLTGDAPAHRPRESNRTAPVAGRAPSVRPAVGVATRGIGSPSMARSLWGRYWARMPWWGRIEVESGPVGDQGELGQPARRFLRKASYIQASVWIAARLAEGLDHAHARGLLHRDLKPSNILIAADGTPMLLDFNLSTEAGGPDPDGGAKAMVGGTLPYMAPEHLDAFNPRGSTPPEAVDERSDIYALGLILFEMIAGRHPFSDPPGGVSLAEVFRLMTQERLRGAPSLREAHPMVPRSLDALLKKCLDPVPDRRYARAGDFAEDLRRHLDDLPLKHAPEPSLRERLAKWARRNPRASSSTSIALVASALIVGIGCVLGLVAERHEFDSARLQLLAFREAFDKAQLMLNATSGPIEHLEQGIDEAQRALDDYGIGQAEDWTAKPPVRRLRAREQEALREDASELTLLVARARVYLAERRGSEPDRKRALEWAVAWLDRAEAFDPRPSAALYGDRARYEAALGLADDAARDRGRRDRTPLRTSRDFALLGTSALAHHRPDEAEPLLLRAVELDSRRFWAWFTLGLCHADQGRYLEAAGDFNVCTALVPRFAWPYLNRGLALTRAGRLADARLAYDRALEENSHFVEALVDRALLCLELGDPAQAARDLDRVIAESRDRPDPAILAARVEADARLGRRGAARRSYDALIASHPDNPTLRVARGVFLLAEPDPPARDLAEADFARALAIDPANPRAHLGRAYLLRNTDPIAAAAEVERALDADPNLIDALQLRALLRARQGDAASLVDVDRILKAATPHRLYDAACALAALAKASGDPKLVPRALDLLKHALDAGYPPDRLEGDPDLSGLRDRSEFRAMLGRKEPSK